MGEKEFETSLLLLLICLPIAETRVISYELKTHEGHMKSYETDKLIESFFKYKVHEDGAVYYIDFIKDLGRGKYIAFKHHSKKYVKYDDIMNAFLEAKTNGENFDLEEYMLSAKALYIS